MGRTDYSTISLDNLLSNQSLLFSRTHDSEYDPTLIELQIGPTPDQPGLPPGPALKQYKNQLKALYPKTLIFQSNDKNFYQFGLPLEKEKLSKSLIDNQTCIQIGRAHV